MRLGYDSGALAKIRRLCDESRSHYLRYRIGVSKRKVKSLDPLLSDEEVTAQAQVTEMRG